MELLTTEDFIFLEPDRSGDWVDGHAEAIAMAVGEDLLDVWTDFTALRLWAIT